MTENELAEMIKLRGEVINQGVFGISGDKYIEWASLLYGGDYFFTYTILACYKYKCHHETIDIFDNEYMTNVAYNNLLTNLNGQIEA